jgi:hypothetical protein
MRRNNKSLQRNDGERKGTLIAPSMLPRFSHLLDSFPERFRSRLERKSRLRAQISRRGWQAEKRSPNRLQPRSLRSASQMICHSPGANPSRVADPKFVTQFCEQAFDPANRTGGFDPQAHRPQQISVERLGLAVLVIQPPFGQLHSGLIQHRDSLVARGKITSYDHHRSAPFSRTLVVSAVESTRMKEPATSSNQPSQASS